MQQAQIIVSFTRARAEPTKEQESNTNWKQKKDACVGGEEKEREEPAGGKEWRG